MVLDRWSDAATQINEQTILTNRRQRIGNLPRLNKYCMGYGLPKVHGILSLFHCLGSDRIG